MIKNTYDSLGRITDIAHSRGENILADYHYKWDAANRITEINDDKYGYDKTNQLLSAVYAKKPKEQYAYDLNGNRLTALLQGQEKKYETGKFNRLLSENGEKLEYDAEGNRIAKGDVKYEWDHRNRLIKVTTPSETIEYTYDYQNRLVKRSAGKNITHFIHDGWQIVRQCENGKPIKRFLWGTKQDELLCDNDNWTLGDHLNTVRDVINTDGKVIAHCDYNAFGKCLSPLKDLSFAYTGKMTDSATNLQWNINRWYDANVGKWISEDPIGFKGRDVNLYRYVGNNNIASRDIFGLLSTNKAKDLVYNKWIINGNGDCGMQRIRKNLEGQMLIGAFNDVVVDGMLLGISLPASLTGKITVSTLKNIVDKAFSYNTATLSDNMILQIIWDTLGNVGTDATVLVPVIKKMIEDASSYSSGECTIYSPHNVVEALKRRIEVTCSLLVCKKVSGQWKISGICTYNCKTKGAKKCPNFNDDCFENICEEKKTRTVNLLGN